MTSRLLHLHFKMSRLALVSWALAMFTLGALSVFWVPEMPAYGPAHLPLPAVGSLVFYLVVYALIFSSGCLSNNQRDNMLLTLGTLPLRRRHTALGKSMFFALAVAGLAFVGWASSALAVAIVEADISIERLALSTVVGYLLVMTVFSYTLIASAMVLEPENRPGPRLRHNLCCLPGRGDRVGLRGTEVASVRIHLPLLRPVRTAAERDCRLDGNRDSGGNRSRGAPDSAGDIRPQGLIRLNRGQASIQGCGPSSYRQAVGPRGSGLLRAERPLSVISSYGCS